MLKSRFLDSLKDSKDLAITHFKSRPGAPHIGCVLLGFPWFAPQLLHSGGYISFLDPVGICNPYSKAITEKTNSDDIFSNKRKKP